MEKLLQQMMYAFYKSGIYTVLLEIKWMYSKPLREFYLFCIPNYFTPNDDGSRYLAQDVLIIILI
jgi:hypothetical protein